MSCRAGGEWGVVRTEDRVQWPDDTITESNEATQWNLNSCSCKSRQIIQSWSVFPWTRKTWIPKSKTEVPFSLKSYHLVLLFSQPVMKVSMNALVHMHTHTHVHMYIHTHRDMRRNRLIPLLQWYTHMHTHTYIHTHTRTWGEINSFSCYSDELFFPAAAKCLWRSEAEISASKISQLMLLRTAGGFHRSLPGGHCSNLWLALSSDTSGQLEYDRMTDRPLNGYWQTN